MQSKITKSLLEIDLNKISANYNILKKRLSSDVVFSAVVKASAYGLGVKYIAKKLYNIGCREFYVAHFDEAIELRYILESRSINTYILHGLYGADLNEMLENDFIPVLNTIEDIKIWSDMAKKTSKKLPVNIHIDTGMNRLGLSSKGISYLRDNSDILAGFDIRYIMSHLSCADDINNSKNKEQLLKFKLIAASMGNYKLSFANSSGVFLGKDYHFNQIRTGCAIYGINPVVGIKNPMQSVITLKAPILQIDEVYKGEAIGYGAAYLVKKTIKTATISVGYADGILRVFIGGSVYIKGYKCQVLGRISMDTMVIDISGVKLPVMLGDYVEIIGENQSVDDIALQSKTIGYEILTSLGNRYKRVYSGLE